MSSVRLGDKTFSLFIPESKIRETVKALAQKINADFNGKKPLFIAVLNGAFLFAADFLREISIECEISFVKLASYEGTGSTEKVKQLLGFAENLTGRNIVILEDIVDTGNTLVHIFAELEKMNPASVTVAALLFKPAAHKKNIPVAYAGMEIPNDFIVGYGLDYNGMGRNLKDVYKLDH